MCDEFEIEGCTDAVARNYDAANTEEDGLGEYAHAVTHEDTPYRLKSMLSTALKAGRLPILHRHGRCRFLECHLRSLEFWMNLSTSTGFNDEFATGATAEGIMLRSRLIPPWLTTAG